jgi:hypothetical protein
MSEKVVFRSSPHGGWYYQYTLLIPVELRGRATEILAEHGLLLRVIDLDRGILALTDGDPLVGDRAA